MITLLRTNSKNPEFIALVRELDAYLTKTDGDEHAFYDQYNKIDRLNQVVVLFENDIAVACGAIKEFDAITTEVKRMYTRPDHRGKGFASKVLQELELWTAELGYQKCILETGIRQFEAVAFYDRNQYTRIPNFGQYEGVENSVCFEKVLSLG